MSLSTLSLKLRIACLFGLVCAFLLGVISLYVYKTLANGIALQEDKALQERTERIKTVIRNASLTDIQQLHPQLYANMLDNKESLLWVVDAQGHVIIEVNPEQIHVPDTTKHPSLFTLQTTPPVRLAWSRLQQPTTHYTIIAGKLLHSREQMLTSYRLNLLISWITGVILAFLLGWEVVRRGLKPLITLSSQVRKIDAQHLTLRVDTDKQPDELKTLSSSFNSMLNRLQDGYAQLSQFSEDLAHEMRTPLNNLMGQNQLTLNQRRSITDYENLLISQQEEYERLARMIDSMLFLARAEKPDAVLDLEIVDLQQLATQLNDYFEGLAQEKNIFIEADMTGFIRADYSLVRRALANLIANAIRYGKENSCITLNTTQDGSCTIITISNKGDQIPKVHQERIFDRFYRCDASRSNPDDSGGLGLAIVKSIMNLHGGHVSLKSGEKITEFSLHFPLSTHSKQN